MADILQSFHLDNPANSGTDIRILMQLALLHGCTDEHSQAVQVAEKVRKTENGKRKAMEAPEWLLVGGNQVVRNPWRRGPPSSREAEGEGGMWGRREGGGERREGGALARMGSGDSNISQRCSSGAHSAVDHTDASDPMWPPPPTSFSLPSPLPFPSLSPSFPPDEPWLPSDLPPLVSAMDPSLPPQDMAAEASGNFPSFLGGSFQEGGDFMEGSPGEIEGEMVLGGGGGGGGGGKGRGEGEGGEGGEGEGEVSLEEAVFEWEKLLPLDFCEETNVQEKKTESGQMENLQNLSDLEPDWLQFEEFKETEEDKNRQKDEDRKSNMGYNNNWDYASENSHLTSELSNVVFKNNNNSFNCSNGSNWGFVSEKDKNYLPSPSSSSRFETDTCQTGTFQSTTFQNSTFPNRTVQKSTVPNRTAQNTASVNGAAGHGGTAAGSFQEGSTDPNLLDRFRLALSKSSPSDAALASAILLLTRPEGKFPEISQKVHGIQAANQRAEALMAAAAKRVPEDFLYEQTSSMQFSAEGRKRKERESDEWEKSSSRYLSPPPPLPPHLSSSDVDLSSISGEGWRGNVRESETTRSRIIVPQLRQNQQQNNLYLPYSTGNRARWNGSGANAQSSSHGNLNLVRSLSGLGANQVPPGGVSLEAQLADLQKEWSGKRTVGCLDLASLNVDLWIPRR